MTIWFASGNKNKREELSRIFNEKAQKWTIITPDDKGIKFEPVEDAGDFAGNALKKAQELYKLIKEPVIADDSGICLDALNGRPGIFSARYGSENGKKLESHERNALLLAELGDNPQRTARFVCAMCLLIDINRFFIVQEILEGEIIHESRGKDGFGYDPVMYLPEYGVTVAELSAKEKNTISHRAKAARAVLRFLENLNGSS
ncbi:MAG: RdgB/HAM1 family non-canonical purine NTP pyrophosphatase [Spirochaetaceae bacterium]|jgi:XTP/dITP diphosphohydrolase|nr:RdgB/HAM1 family non-canonical purine NTP pyrophosphatase [Spirochaetaceae bacterium]